MVPNPNHQRVPSAGCTMRSENKMKKFLMFLWSSLMVAACGSVSPASPTAIPATPIATTPIVTSFHPEVTVTSIIPYTSTPAEVCPINGINGPGVYLDETPVFAIRQGPGCEYEATHPMIVKNDPLAFFDILEKEGDWLFVDLCNDRKGWVFAPAIDDINIHLDSDDFPGSAVVSPTQQTPRTDKRAIEQAKNTLTNFFDLLYEKKYAEAAELFSGGYGMIIMWNSNVDPQDHASLLSTACEFNDFQCSLRISRVVEEEGISPMEYNFIVEFIREDGSIYQRPDSNGAETSQFSFRVVKDCNDKYFVVDWPFYSY